MKIYTNVPMSPHTSTIANISHWMMKNLFSSPINTLLTVVGLWLIYRLTPPMVEWMIINANFAGDNNQVCAQNPEGACWVFVKVRFWQMMLGLYYSSHPEQIWRPLTTMVAFGGLMAYFVLPSLPHKHLVGILAILGFPFVAFALLHGRWLGLPVADTSQWGGFLLTLVLATVGITVALPIGIFMALGRQSKLPVIRFLSLLYIEAWRGAPLLTVLFMASFLLPLFLPENISFDKVARALIGISLFQSAYVAEAVRGGLAAIPKGQIEAADALGLSYFQKMAYIILPQALKISIPAIVNCFIALFKDTSLVSIIGLLDLLNMAHVSSSSLEWQGYEIEAYLFAAFMFWICCFYMSQYSQNLEKKLTVRRQ